MRHWLYSCIAAVALLACGHPGGNNGDGGNGDGTGGNGDGGFGGLGDGMYSGTCTPGGATQCADCADNDGDGKIDGFDPECTGPADNREDSFATGIPGDNIDATWQDCFFDGNSGAGNDGCNQHVCCLLQLTKQQCADGGWPHAAQYNVNECYQPFGSTPVPQKCIDVCAPLTPPGCDCFGCCTVCQTSNDPTSCRDVILNPAVSPTCDSTNITSNGADGVDGTGDEPCKRCVKNTQCGSSECGGATCILCPGQDPSSLPPSCSGSSTCPTGIIACAADGSCAANTYCSNGCCIGAIL